MAVISASPFTILRDWTNNMLADSHRGFDLSLLALAGWRATARITF